MINYEMKAGCISFNPCTDQMNNMIWSILEIRLKRRSFFTFGGFQKAFYNELQIMEHNLFKMTLTRQYNIYY